MRSLILLALLALSAGLHAAPPPTIVQATPTLLWTDAFNQSEVVTLNDKDASLPGVTVHYKTGTLYQVSFTQQDLDAPVAASASLWQAVRMFLSISFGHTMTDATWKTVAAAAYEAHAGKTNADDVVGEWPEARELPSYLPLEVKLYVAGVLEYDGHYLPLCILGTAPPSVTMTPYLFDNLDVNNLEHFCVKPCFILESGVFKLTDFGGPTPDAATMAKRSVLENVHLNGGILVDIWLEPDLDRLLPQLSANPDYDQ